MLQNSRQQLLNILTSTRQTYFLFIAAYKRRKGNKGLKWPQLLIKKKNDCTALLMISLKNQLNECFKKIWKLGKTARPMTSYYRHGNVMFSKNGKKIDFSWSFFENLAHKLTEIRLLFYRKWLINVIYLCPNMWHGYPTLSHDWQY